MKRRCFTAACLALMLASCKNSPHTQPDLPILSVTSSSFGTTSDGHEVQLFTLTNTKGMKATVSEYGALLTSVMVPDKEGKVVDVTLGYDKLADWEENEPYFGATVGRFGNRIAGGSFTLDGKTHSLAINNDPGGIPCALHGGKKGFDKVIWSGQAVEQENARGVKLIYQSPDGEEGYPGKVDISVTYWLSEENDLTWEVEAISDAPTPINIVHHTYWNLSGDATRTILDHELQIYAAKFLPTNNDMIPTGEKVSVTGTPLDFTQPTVIGSRIEEKYEPLIMANGYDHCFVLSESQDLRPVARLTHPESGRVLEVLADQPGIQIYTGNFLDGHLTGKNGVAYQNRSGVCLETQNFPDAPNKPEFPNSILRPGETYRHTMVMRFGW